MLSATPAAALCRLPGIHTVPAEVAVAPPTLSDFSQMTPLRPSSAPTSAAVIPATPAPITSRSVSASQRRLSVERPVTRTRPAQSFQRPDRQRMRNAAVDVLGQDRLRAVGVALQRAIQQRLMLRHRRAAAVLQGVAEIFVEHDGMGMHQLARPA